MIVTLVISNPGQQLASIPPQADGCIELDIDVPAMPESGQRIRLVLADGTEVTLKAGQPSFLVRLLGEQDRRPIDQPSPGRLLIPCMRMATPGEQMAALANIGSKLAR